MKSYKTSRNISLQNIVIQVYITATFSHNTSTDASNQESNSLLTPQCQRKTKIHWKLAFTGLLWLLRLKIVELDKNILHKFLCWFHWQCTHFFRTHVQGVCISNFESDLERWGPRRKLKIYVQWVCVPNFELGLERWGQRRKLKTMSKEYMYPTLNQSGRDADQEENCTLQKLCALWARTAVTCFSDIFLPQSGLCAQKDSCAFLAPSEIISCLWMVHPEQLDEL
jgi:hypothetical protein